MSTEYVGSVILYLGANEVEVTKIDVKDNTGKKPVKTMNRTRRVKGFTRGVGQLRHYLYRRGADRRHGGGLDKDRRRQNQPGSRCGRCAPDIVPRLLRHRSGRQLYRG